MHASFLPPFFHPHLLAERVRFTFGRMGLGKVIKYGRCMDAVPMNQVLIPRTRCAAPPPPKLVQFPPFLHQNLDREHHRGDPDSLKCFLVMISR